MNLIINIDNHDYVMMENGYVLLTFNPISVILNGIPIPDDVITGDILKTLIPMDRYGEAAEKELQQQREIEKIEENSTPVEEFEEDRPMTDCTECPYFKNDIYEGEQWYGAICKKDGHSTMPSMYAIKLLHDHCPYKAESEFDSVIQNDTPINNAANEICGDNRFEIIAKAKEDIIRATNIENAKDEMKCLDNFLFRCWQMGWLDKYASYSQSQDKKNIPICEKCKWAFKSCRNCNDNFNLFEPN